MYQSLPVLWFVLEKLLLHGEKNGDSISVCEVLDNMAWVYNVLMPE